MNNYLIFRTDRIGDFLISAILIKCIKKNDPNSHITLISSKKNYAYIKTFPYVDKVISLNNSFFGKIILFFKLIKFNFKYIIIHDDKNRSKFISLFLKSSLKINIDSVIHIRNKEAAISEAITSSIPAEFMKTKTLKTPTGEVSVIKTISQVNKIKQPVRSRSELT